MRKDLNSLNFKKILIMILIMVIIVLLIVILSDNSRSENSYVITLKGNRYVTITTDEKYVEPGYFAFDSNNNDVTNEVVVKNDVDESVPGVYRIIYQINDYYEYRIVEVQEKEDNSLEILLEQNTTSLTNGDVTVKVTVTGKSFTSLILPDNSISTTNQVTFDIKENGIYKFEAINNINESFVKEIVIDNIDKEAPSGTCIATLTRDNTKVIVTLEKEEDIKYLYYDNDKLVTTSLNNNYDFKYQTTNTIYVVLEDNAKNEIRIKCTNNDNRYYDQVKPQDNEKIVYYGDTDTLKAYIVNRGSYYLTYIWVKDAYHQLNKYDSPEYGVNLYKPSVLLEKSVEEKSLQNKLIIGFNASAFYLKDTYDAYSVNMYPAYNRTSVGTLVITDGKVIRNAYDHAVKTWYTIGIDPNNKLRVFEDTASNDIMVKKNWSESVISSGIRNTFTFAAPIIENGQRTNITTSMPGGYTNYKGLQIICQINDNNFLLFTSNNQTRNKAIEEFSKLGCQTAMNLDGNGSIALLYKDKNSDKLVNVIGNMRALPEVGYFSE